VNESRHWWSIFCAMDMNKSKKIRDDLWKPIFNNCDLDLNLKNIDIFFNFVVSGNINSKYKIEESRIKNIKKAAESVELELSSYIKNNEKEVNFLEKKVISLSSLISPSSNKASEILIKWKFPQNYKELIENMKLASKHFHVLKEEKSRIHDETFKSVSFNKDDGINPNQIASIDPGFGTFGVMEKGDGTVVEYGDGFVKRILRILNAKVYYQAKEDTTQNTIQENPSNQPLQYQKKKWNKKKNQCYSKIKGMVDNLHNKILNDIKKQKIKVLLFPNFNTKQMIKKKKVPIRNSNGEVKIDEKTQQPIIRKRKIGKAVVKGLQHLAFGRFRRKLESYCKSRGIYLYIVDEWYTSKTCRNCHYQNESLKKRIFECQNCSFKTHRDWNSPGNIFWANMVRCGFEVLQATPT